MPYERTDVVYVIDGVQMTPEEYRQRLAEERMTRIEALLVEIRDPLSGRLAEEPPPDAASGMPSNPLPDLLEKGDGSP